MIDVSGITKRFRNATEPAVNAVDLHVAKGEIFGLIGPNGAGKTTLISMMCNLVKPSSGNIQINGQEFGTNSKELKSFIGIVPQDIALYGSLTAQENLRYFGSMYGLKGKALSETIKRHLDLLGLSDFQDRKIEHFSGGMKRRINLAASILHNPGLIFLDEPTVGVDVQSRQAIIEHLNTLHKGGVTILYTSHLLNEAQQFCTDMAILDRGSILARGRPQELVQEKGVRDLEELFISLTGKALRDHV